MKQSIAPLFAFCKLFFAPAWQRAAGKCRKHGILTEIIHKLEYHTAGCMERSRFPNPGVGHESLFLYNFKRVSSIEAHGRICYYTHKDRETDQKIMNFEQEAYVL